MHKLRPLQTTQKLLVSTTSSLTGEFATDQILISHAWPDFQTTFSENYAPRKACIVAFQTEPLEKRPGTIVPNFTWFGDVICVYLSILYGKRFDNHGLVESHGGFRLPNYSLFQSLSKPQLPQNTHVPRRDIAINLNLEEVRLIEPLLWLNPANRFATFLLAAGKFYLQALQNFEERPEVAYLNLITAGEVLSNYYDYDKNELLDDHAKKVLCQIEESSDSGPELARQIKERLLQVKQRFIRTIETLLTDAFFLDSEADARLRLEKKNIKSSLGAAYDLRSQHIHSGISFGVWISRTPHGTVSEIQMSTPLVGNREFGRTLAKAPTYFGLERLIRYCLLRFIHTHGIKIDTKLDS